MERSADWLDQAQGDLALAQLAISGAFYDWSCLAAQQAAEKAAEAVLNRSGSEAWGHSVADLLQEVRGLHAVGDDLINLALELDKAYIPSRYPDAHPSWSPRRRYTRNQAE